MGKSNSKLKRKELRSISQKTSFTTKEINAWYKVFSKEFPTGKISPKEFSVKYNQGKRNKDKFAIGSFEEKVKFMFDIYDIDGDGFITRDEMLAIMRAVDLMGDDVDYAEDESTPELRVDKIFQQIDFNGDGKLEPQEMVEGIKMYPSIAKLLAAYEC
ncbi:neuronal calcium sensor 1-like isoform X2 [Symsagittifera roscoffensis]|uniref:neuronal calcium sensor 1-like isoform X2 n=1 Tax=Symsagittifera roscoffensis TaxID=84072 RepID=UPI00307B948C